MFARAVEPLERRSLFSASLTNGVLTVVGTPGPDTIVVGGSGSTIHAELNGSLISGSPFTGITSIVIQALGGKDTVTVDPSISQDMPVTVMGGAGGDLIAAQGGSGDLLGGKGTDTLAANAGQYFIVGGAGRDSLFAFNQANDILHGGPGADTLFAANGLNANQHAANHYILEGGAGANSITSNHDTATIISTSGMDSIVGSLYGDNLIWEITGGDYIIGHSANDPGADTVFTGDNMFNDLLGGLDQLNPGPATAPPNAVQLLSFVNSVTNPSLI